MEVFKNVAGITEEKVAQVILHLDINFTRTLADHLIGGHSVADFGYSQTYYFLQRMLAQLMDVQSKDDDKIVVLAHDREFAPPRGGSVNMRVALEKFIAMAKQAGFVFRKLSDYPSDY